MAGELGVCRVYRLGEGMSKENLGSTADSYRCREWTAGWFSGTDPTAFADQDGGADAACGPRRKPTGTSVIKKRYEDADCAVAVIAGPSATRLWERTLSLRRNGRFGLAGWRADIAQSH